MKLLKNIGLLAIMMIAMVACVEKTPDYGNFPSKDVDFTYNVDGSQFLTDFYVVSTMQFNNTSAKTGAVSWDFGDGNKSTEANPTHKYDAAGLYKVTLSVDGVGSRTYPILIYDIAPVLTVSKQSADIVVINDVDVEMNIFLPNPENLKCQYTWIFPEGTMNENGDEIKTWVGYSHEDGSIDYPGKLKFKNIGSQKIEIQTIFDFGGEGQRRLEDSYVNVQVGCNYPCKTLYYATIDGNIKAYKLVDAAKVPEGTKVGAFDLGVKSGSHSTQLVYANVNGQDYIYILDSGKQYYYVNDVDGNLGDGRIVVMSADGSYSDVMVTNVGQKAFGDPFQGCTDGTYLYYTDRGTGIRKLPLTTRGQVEASDWSAETGYLVTNQHLGYYGRGIAYGAIHSSLVLDSKGVFYWAKNYSGQGIYRFLTSDIDKLNDIPHPILLSGAFPKAFNIDEKRSKMYAWLSRGSYIGFNSFALPALDGKVDTSDKEQFFAMDADPINTTADEGVYVTQFAIDSDNGNVYFGFNAANTEKSYTTGIKYYDFTNKKIVSLNNNGEKALGIAICDTPTKLF